LFKTNIEKLTELELNTLPSSEQAISVIQKAFLITKISQSLKKQIVELGKEAGLLKTGLRELTVDLEKEVDLVLKDYATRTVKKAKSTLESLNYEEIFDRERIIRAISTDLEIPKYPGGWRILSKTSLSESEITQLAKSDIDLKEFIQNQKKDN